MIRPDPKEQAATTSAAAIYTVPSGYNGTISKMSAHNRDATTAYWWEVYISHAGAAAAAGNRAWKRTIGAEQSDIPPLTGHILPPGAIIYIKGEAADKITALLTVTLTTKP